MRIEFGIPSIDELIWTSPVQPTPASLSTRESLSIIGPDGVGKSVLAMHAASWYWLNTRYHAETKREEDARVGREPLIIYVSTDFRFAQFLETWQAFGLHRPALRMKALNALADFNFLRYGTPDWGRVGECVTSLSSEEHSPPDLLVPLQPATPFEHPPEWLKLSHTPDSDAGILQWKSIKDLLNGEDISGEQPVWFLDLADFSGGDDWLLINRLCGLLSSLNSELAPGIPHLFIVDAVEGVEAMTGDIDPFGTQHSRRSRVAQFMRTAANAHVSTMLILEETSSGEKLPEEFITDTVVRIRNVKDEDYTRRTVSIEKARGSSHVRGEHDLVISAGDGTLAGGEETPIHHIDEPKVEIGDKKSGKSLLSYVYSSHSLHAYSQVVSREKRFPPKMHATPQTPLFGLRHLRHMLGQKDENSPEKETGSVTVLLGDSGTFKSKLARNFLAQTFAEKASQAKPSAVLISTYSAGIDDLSDQLRNHALQAVEQGELRSPLSFTELQKELGDAVKERRIISRRIPLQYLTSSSFLRIVRAHIRHCQMLLGDHNRQHWEVISDPEKFKNNGHDQQVAWAHIREQSWRIRIVIDDWNLMLASHPALARDPLLLPALYYLLRRSGVTALIVSTQADRPTLPASSHVLSGQHVINNLQSLDTHQICVWPVLFFGERRVAITAAAGSSTIARSIAYELTPAQNEARQKADASELELLQIDRRFALYDGLYENKPRRIPIQLRLFLDEDETTNARKSYLQEITKTFTEQFPEQDGKPSVTYEPIDSYGDFASYVDWLDNSANDSTNVLQLDEFWLQDRSLNSLLNLNSYVLGRTASLRIDSETGEKRIEADLDNDPLRRFQPNTDELDTKRATFQRIEAFPPDSLTRMTSEQIDEDHRLEPGYRPGHWGYDRVPYLKDFGFLLVRRDLWARALSNPQVEAVWDKLALLPEQDDYATPRENRVFSYTSWSDFFRACEIVRGSEAVPAFDVDFSIGETLNALLLEVWFSEILETATPFYVNHRKGFHQLSLRNGLRTPSLKKLVDAQRTTFMISLSRLMGACSHLLGEPIRTHRPANPDAVASRHWYSSATAAMKKNPDLVPMRLPGRYSTRGDWFLGGAAGSQSELAAHRAMDILTSRRMNLLRLQDGLGLPGRRISEGDDQGNRVTAMHVIHPTLGRHRHLMLGEIECMEGRFESIKNAVDHSEERDPNSAQFGDDAFFPLWRSQITNYDRHSFYLFRWLVSLFWEGTGPILQLPEDISNKQELVGLYKKHIGDRDVWTDAEIESDSESEFGPFIFSLGRQSTADFELKVNRLKAALRE
ncbi:hypothetical protein GYB59_01320 [bacterium]|nr:hypothetical protein [bacterium]